MIKCSIPKKKENYQNIDQPNIEQEQEPEKEQEQEQYKQDKEQLRI